MDLSSLLVEPKAHNTRGSQASHEGSLLEQDHERRIQSISSSQPEAKEATPTPVQQTQKTMSNGGGFDSHTTSHNLAPKHVKFELLVDDSTQHRARLPMRVNIYPHDTTESIIITVKNFYGLYEGKGVSFEDRNGHTLIARYENFEDQMAVYVRVVLDELESARGSQTPRRHHSQTPRNSVSPRKPHLGPAFQMLPPQFNNGQSISRPSSRTARKRSKSPQSGRGRRSASTSTNPKTRSRPGIKSRGSSFADQNGDVLNDGSDSELGEGSVTSSRRGKNELVASAEISVDNIVEGGRRKRAKFDSSELPLFVPPQVPMTASISSVSPQRRVSDNHAASPFSYSNQHTFSYTHPLPSPQSYGNSDYYTQGATPYSGTSVQPYGSRLRTRGPVQYMPARHANGGTSGVLPTPDPTIGSVISDEDVALQLMRLGDVSNFSSHARTSTSTLDDALSGKAEVASSAEESDEGTDIDEQDLPSLPYGPYPGGLPNHNGQQGFGSGETSGDDYEDNNDGSFKGESDELVPDEHGFMRPKPVKSRSTGSGTSKIRNGVVGSRISKPGKPRAHSPSKAKTKLFAGSKLPISPSSLPPQSRKTSNASLNFQHQLAVDEEDLSTKPRCQRCRKSKKGCDRQRPCQRCKDAGIGIEGCISEDEGNGRKGRYGRHMGVPVKKTSMEPVSAPGTPYTGPLPGYMPPPPPIAAADKSKKRKR